MSIIPGFQTKAQIKALLDAHGAAPRKRYGQCFLIDRNLMDRVLLTAGITACDWVLEIGCGTGSLTGELLNRAGRVVGVEIDSALQVILAELYGESRHFSLIAEDALATKSSIAPAVIDAMVEARSALTGRGLLVANLPYDVATSLLVELLLGDYGIERFVFTVQLEMAERLRAAANTPAYGAVSVLAQTLADVQVITKLPPQAFWPAPKVQSAIVRMDRLPSEAIDIEDTSAFAAFVRTAFQSRRKRLSGTLKRMYASPCAADALLAKAGIAAEARPEVVTVEQWGRLISIWHKRT